MDNPQQGRQEGNGLSHDGRQEAEDEHRDGAEEDETETVMTVGAGYELPRVPWAVGLGGVGELVVVGVGRLADVPPNPGDGIIPLGAATDDPRGDGHATAGNNGWCDTLKLPVIVGDTIPVVTDPLAL